MSQNAFEITIEVEADKILLHLPNEEHALPEKSIDFQIISDLQLND